MILWIQLARSTRITACKKNFAATIRLRWISSSPVQQVETQINGPVLIEPTVHRDERGFFMESFRANVWAENGVDVEFVQDNHSRSSRGTLRGMHFQLDPGQAKLVRCASGSVYDVIVDLRKGSPTFGQWEGFELSDENFRQLFIPVGFAHGFCVTSETADFVYKCSSYFDPKTESQVTFDDPDIGIVWPKLDLLVSARDRTAPTLREIQDTLPF